MSSGKNVARKVSASSKNVISKRPLPPKPVPVSKKTKQDDLEPVSDEEPELNPEPEISDEEEIARAPRKKATIIDHIRHYDQLFEMLDAEIDRKSREKEKGARALRSMRKILTQMRKEVPHVTKSKEARKQSSTRKETTSGLMMTFAISKELADFLKVPADSRFSRVEVTRAICVYAHLKDNEKREDTLRWKYLNPDGKRDLQFPQDKKAIIPDKALAKLLRYDEYKKKVAAGQVTYNTKNKDTGKVDAITIKTEALYYWAIQSLLNIHFLKEESSSTEEVEDDQ